MAVVRLVCGLNLRNFLLLTPIDGRVTVANAGDPGHPRGARKAIRKIKGVKTKYIFKRS